MNRTKDQVWQELEKERLKLKEMNKRGYMGQELFSVMNKIFELWREHDQIAQKNPIR